MFNTKADLTEIAEGPKELVVSNVIQKAGINVNEQGSTAYAATGNINVEIIWNEECKGKVV